MWHELLVAFCLVLVIEGLLPSINPGMWKRLVMGLGEVSDRQIRIAGLTFMFIGAFLLYLFN